MSPVTEQQFVLDCLGEWNGLPAEVREVLSSHGLEIVDAGKTGGEGVSIARCARFLLSSPEAVSLSFKEELFAKTDALRLDLILRRGIGPFPPVKLLVMDVDSTVIQNEMIDELARQKGAYEEIRAITERAMRGELDFTQSLTKRVARLAGLTSRDVEGALSRMRLSPGAAELMAGARRMGCKTALVSGGFRFVVERLQKILGVDVVHANELETSGGIFTGKISGQILDADRKAELLAEAARSFGCAPEEVLAVGDGANDVKMMKRAGLGIGYRPKPVLWKSVDGLISSGDLRSILPVISATRIAA